jgi:hypothetical protein
MRRLQLIRNEPRESLGELDPGLRERLLPLDEPVGREDWQDVLERSRRFTPLAHHARAIVVVAATFVVGMAAGSMLGFRPFSASHSGGTGLAASVVSQEGSGVDLGVASGGVASASPITISFQLPSGAQTLFVTQRNHEGFCYVWLGEAHGCEVRAESLGVAWGKNRIVGTVSSDVSSVAISFTDGTVAVPQIAWVSGSIDRGFFLYAIPSGKTVAAVVANDHGSPRGRVPWWL